MLTIFLIFLTVSIFGKLALFAFKATWKIGKAILLLVFLPIILIVLLVVGLLYLALPILIIVGIVSLILPKKANN